MKKTLQLSSLIFITFNLLSCGTSKTLRQLGWSKGCPLERLEWMEVSEGYDSKTMLEIATKLEAAAQADLKDINGNVKANGSLTTALNDVVNKNGTGRIQVSQSFYETYVNNRLAICGLYQSIKDGLFENDADAIKKARDTYINLLGALNEQKKILNATGTKP